MKKKIFATLLFSFALSLSACASGSNTTAQQQTKCGHLELCHYGHHHGGRQDSASEQHEAEQTLE